MLTPQTPPTDEAGVLVAPWYRKPLCWAGLCETFSTNSDDRAVWGECSICGKRAGEVSRDALRRYADRAYAEAEAVAKAREQDNERR